jgi:dTDP-4-dehydrorhamnose 3,5-epimerase
MKFKPTKIIDVIKITPNIENTDHRGMILELANAEKFADVKLPSFYIRENLSFSIPGTLRGLHYQNPYSSGIILHIISGRIFNVAVDLRKYSPTFGQHVGMYLDSDFCEGVYIPPGFAHGFFVTKDETAWIITSYTKTYNKENEHSIKWNDPDLNIKWPLNDFFCQSDIENFNEKQLIISDEDLNAGSFKDCIPFATNLRNY